MALQDLTPQLRTRLSRMERAVGWFVLLATALLVFGFGYYIYSTAQRKGWFKIRAPYYTGIDRATGLSVGDPVVMMGFPVGQITKVKPMPPDFFDYDVYVEFEIKEPDYGYMWTVGSRAKVEGDFLGKRGLEVTKGTGGHATYVFSPRHELTLAEAEGVREPEKWQLGEDIYDASGTNMLVPALKPLEKETLARLRQLGVKKFPAFDLREKLRKSPTAVWNDQEGRYVKFFPKENPETGVKANIYYLPAEETPAVNERVEKLVKQIESGLGQVFAFTNQITAVLSNATQLTSNFNLVALNAQPTISNLAVISTQLRGPGALGEWILGTNGFHQMIDTLESANATIDAADTNLAAIGESITRTLNNLADITSNLNAQVQANTNMLGSISKAVVDADDLVQGMKRHWLLRSAFKPGKTNETSRATSPKDSKAR